MSRHLIVNFILRYFLFIFLVSLLSHTPSYSSHAYPSGGPGAKLKYIHKYFQEFVFYYLSVSSLIRLCLVGLECVSVYLSIPIPHYDIISHSQHDPTHPELLNNLQLKFSGNQASKKCFYCSSTLDLRDPSSAGSVLCVLLLQVLYRAQWKQNTIRIFTKVSTSEHHIALTDSIHNHLKYAYFYII